MLTNQSALMKNLSLIFALIPFIAFSKTRLEDYYFGFEIATVVEDNGFDGETYDLSTNLVPLENASIQLNLTFSDFDDDAEMFDLGASYLYRFQNFDGFVPFAGVGLNYVDIDTADDVLWNLYLGLEFSVSDQLTLLPALRLYQGFDDNVADDTELEASIALTYWLSDNHGVSLSYTHNALHETDYLGLQYLYSWE